MYMVEEFQKEVMKSFLWLAVDMRNEGKEMTVDSELVMGFVKSAYVIRGCVAKLEDYVEEGNLVQECAKSCKNCKTCLEWLRPELETIQLTDLF